MYEPFSRILRCAAAAVVAALAPLLFYAAPAMAGQGLAPPHRGDEPARAASISQDQRNAPSTPVKRGEEPERRASVAGALGDGELAPPQRSEEPPRPTIGLVLSGGGARGLAHLGVIQWFEEHRIPIDKIAGTSMGGLVGGIYATGAEFEEMRRVIDAIDWQRVLRVDAPYPQLDFRRKEDARRAPVPLEIGWRDRSLKLPPGFDPGHQVGLVLDRIAFPYSGLDHFDQLPTPFACVAVDLKSGQQEVFRSGHLSVALRATMSYPGWFAPVRLDDKALVDGAVLNNLPTDVMAQQMGVDIIIAVDLGMLASEVEPVDNVHGVLLRTLSVMMRQNTARNAELADVVVAPDVSEFGFTEFDRSAELVRIGYEATDSLAATIGAHALDEGAWAAFLRGRQQRRAAFAATPEFIEIEGVIEADRGRVEAALDEHLGVPLDGDRLDADLGRIAGWGRYNFAGYERRARGGAEGLGVRVREKAYGPPFVRPVLDISGHGVGPAASTVGGRLTLFDVLGTNSELRVDGTYGHTTRAAAELLVRPGNGGFFVAPRGIAETVLEFGYRDAEPVAEFDVVRRGGGADIGYLFGARSELRFGAEWQHQRATRRVAEPLIEGFSGTYGRVRGRWSFDGTNSAIIPTRGIRVVGEAGWVFDSANVPSRALPATARPADPRFYQARFDVLVAQALGEDWYLLGSASGGSSLGATAATLQHFVVGGPLRLGALGVGERRGSNFYLGRAAVLWRILEGNQPSFYRRFYLAAMYEVGDAFEGFSNPYHGATVGVAGDTILGGVFAGVAVGQQGRHRFFFTVGRLF